MSTWGLRFSCSWRKQAGDNWANGKGAGVVLGYDVNQLEDGSTENDSRPPRGEIGKLFRPPLLRARHAAGVSARVVFFPLHFRGDHENAALVDGPDRVPRGRFRPERRGRSGGAAGSPAPSGARPTIPPAGCVAGAVQHDDYLKIIEETGFKNIELKKTKTVDIPDEILGLYMPDEEIKRYRESGTGIFSITVTAYR